MNNRKNPQKSKVVHQIIRCSLLYFQPFYYLKWLGYTSRYNTWEPEGNMSCDELLNEFNVSRGRKVLGVSKKNLEIFYLISVLDSNDPVCVSSLEARIFWTPLLINFWLSKLEFVGFQTDGNRGPMNVLPAPPNETPQVICEYSTFI